ncbi:hypothetical protein O1611_g4691 [Lasiodiplodia mahajangana]|uniref:Uncharacterized protein n=1 Tax=Lasiodiplodia mahajangana TaxID=1108764 RepID=A0ACC2JNM5_9PEZI|nr:hypothetical protein O1611_g4691 [Lasiodiplodia mahajangana]
MTMQGPSEFVIVGSFKDWEGWKDAHKIEVPTLLLNGRYDEATDQCVQPWFTHIPKGSGLQVGQSSDDNPEPQQPERPTGQDKQGIR